MVFAPKGARQRLIRRLYDDTFPHPLPELFLSSPKLLPILTDHQRGFFLFLLLVLVVLLHFLCRLGPTLSGTV